MGNTPNAKAAADTASVHPHACGEYKIFHRVIADDHGSSPRVWGIRHRYSSSGPRRRFIPTRVGNTQAAPYSGSLRSVHPHACGEYAGRGPQRSRKDGSSPRVWGIPRRWRNGRGTHRFIPTRVGNTSLTTTKSVSPSVHPHACGEYDTAMKEGEKNDGSSPRVWGILQLFVGQRRVGRFIPTRVGNTCIALTYARNPAVHPHACGEYLTSHHRQNSWPGSSPRVWGIPPDGAHMALADRFIPTRVGNTRSTPVPKGMCPVHPHACGEY